MLDSTTPTYSKAECDRLKKRVAVRMAATLRAQGHFRFLASTSGYALYHGIAGNRGLNVNAHSREAHDFYKALALAKATPRSVKAAANEEAVEFELADGTAPGLIDASRCRSIDGRGLAFGMTVVLVAELAIDPAVLTLTRKFAPRLRAPVRGYLEVEDAIERRDHADLLRAAPIAAADLKTARQASGQRDLLDRMQLPPSAAKLVPGVASAIVRRPWPVFYLWAAAARFALLGTTLLVQRRQVEFLQAVAQAVFNMRGIDRQVVDDLFDWSLQHAPEIPSGRLGAGYIRLTIWMIDSVAPRVASRPRRLWSPKISVKNALAAAEAHQLHLRQLRSRHVASPPPADLGTERADQWPRGGDLGDGVFVRRLWSSAAIAAIGRSLNNCLRDDQRGWHSRADAGDVAVYAIIEAGMVSGAVAIAADMGGAFVIIEQRAAANSQLTGTVQAKLQKWVAHSAAVPSPESGAN